jgi:peptidoglycan hydrolase-like protein with peptidoglycan-binding domain
MTLPRLVEWAWSVGVVVIPLPDAAAFHAAFWRIDGRNVIVLKQKHKSAERWMNDLLHDLYHAALDPSIKTRSVVDAEPPNADGDNAEEDAANEYARDVLLAGIADQLIDECVTEAGGFGPRLKAAVPRVARRHGVPVGALANHLAWTLDHQEPPYPMRWWGVADSLQTDNTPDVKWARELCFERLVPPGDADPDVEMLFRALRHEEVG